MRRLSLAVAALMALGGAAQAMSYGGGSPAVMPGTTGFDHYATAQQLLKRREFASAIPHLDAALKAHPGNADILNYLGYAHRMVGADETGAARTKDFQDSLAYYNQALAIDPAHKGVHEYLGELYLQMNDVASAHREMDTLATLCPSGCVERDTLAKALASYVPPAQP
jgi:tetratricopeptide (TPR) repeat protein